MDGGKRVCSKRGVKWKTQEDETSLILWHNQVLNFFEQNWLKFLLL